MPTVNDDDDGGGASTNNRLIMLIQFDINLNKNSSLIRFWFARYNLQYMHMCVLVVSTLPPFDSERGK